MSLCVKVAVVALLVTELTLSVSQQYICSDVSRLSTELGPSSLCSQFSREAALNYVPACGSYNTSSYTAGNTAVRYTSPMTMSSTPYLLPCSSVNTVIVLKEPYPRCRLDSVCYWLCHGAGMASLLPLLLLLATDLATCCQDLCTLTSLLQLLTALILLASNATLQAMLLDTASELVPFNWGTYDSLSHAVFPTIYPLLLVSVLLLRLQLWTMTSACSPIDLCDLNFQPASLDECLVQRLQQLTIGPSVMAGRGSSWMRRAQDLHLLSSPPVQPVVSYASLTQRTHSTAHILSVTTFASSSPSQCCQPTVLRPGHLNQPSLTSATASLSLTDQPSHFLDLL